MVHFYHGADTWKLDAATYFPEQAFGGSRFLARAWRGLQKTVGVESVFGDPLMAGSLKRFLQREGVEVVFSQYLGAGATVQKVAAGLGLRHVVRGLGYDLSSALEVEKWRRQCLALDDVSAIVVPTPYQVERLRAIGLKRVPIHAQPCGIDLPDKAVDHGSTKTEIRAVSAGRMVAKKSPLAALDSFFAAAEQCPSLVLTMVGDGPLARQVRDRCARHPMRGRVTLAGALPHAEMLRQVAEADIFLQHSITDPHTGDQEGAPVAILEAMARGVPVVSTRHSGIPYLVEHGVTGLLSDEGDVVAMGENLARLANDSGLRRSMGDAARGAAVNFTWQLEQSLLMGLLFAEERGRA